MPQPAARLLPAGSTAADAVFHGVPRAWWGFWLGKARRQTLSDAQSRTAALVILPWVASRRLSAGGRPRD
eukprot:6076254-Prymnesium_polylepis.1